MRALAGAAGHYVPTARALRTQLESCRRSDASFSFSSAARAVENLRASFAMSSLPFSPLNMMQFAGISSANRLSVCTQLGADPSRPITAQRHGADQHCASLDYARGLLEGRERTRQSCQVKRGGRSGRAIRLRSVVMSIGCSTAARYSFFMSRYSEITGLRKSSFTRFLSSSVIALSVLVPTFSKTSDASCVHALLVSDRRQGHVCAPCTMCWRGCRPVASGCRPVVLLRSSAVPCKKRWTRLTLVRHMFAE